MLAKVQKKMLRLRLDETYVGTPENPVLSKDALDAMADDVLLDEGIISSKDALDDVFDLQSHSHDALDAADDIEERASSIKQVSGPNGSQRM